MKRDAAFPKVVNKIHKGRVGCPLIESQSASERTSFAENGGVSLKMIDQHDVACYGAILCGSTAFLWQNNVIVDLNTLTTDSPLHLLAAYSINDAGEIAGQGCVMPACTELHAYRAPSFLPLPVGLRERSPSGQRSGPPRE